MVNFTDKLQILTQGKEPAASSLTFLSDLSFEDRTAFRQIWPEIPVERRRRIVDLLTTMGEDNIELYFRPMFLVLLGDSDAKVRVGAIEGLVEDESKQLMSRLIDLLHSDAEPAVREAAAIALGRFVYRAQCGKLGDDMPMLREALLRSARTEQTEVRRRAIESLGYLDGDADARDLIIKAYERGGRDAESAVFAMGRNINERWQQTILDELESDHPGMRYEAARAAGEMNLEDALPFLVRMVHDRDPEVRLAAVWALGQVGGKPAAESLAQALKSNEPSLREAAKEALDDMVYTVNPLKIL